MGKVSCVLVLTDLIRSLDQTDRQTNNATFPDTLGIFVQKYHKENEYFLSIQSDVFLEKFLLECNWASEKVLWNFADEQISQID